VLPGAALQYWTSTIVGANDAMTNAWSGNQSLNGLVLRFQGGQVVLVVLALACVMGAALLALAGVVACFSGWTFGVVPRGDNRELTWSLLESAVGNAYVLVALVAGVLTLARVGPSAHRPAISKKPCPPTHPTQDERAHSQLLVQQTRCPKPRVSAAGPLHEV
jgi:hypothetical protein